jgi:hypothetical protein
LSETRGCTASPNHGLTPPEIQRWEDNGGAILAEPTARPDRAARHHQEESHVDFGGLLPKDKAGPGNHP